MEREILETLRRIESRLIQIEATVEVGESTRTVARGSYSCQEVARLTQLRGSQEYRAFTVRLACADGRIPEANKRANGRWSIPHSAIERILSEGIPPERRAGNPKN